jgi:DNA-directed RNA polymerase subunit RPC12/RpoP
MSNYKFNCPSCGQKILGDTSYVGKQISCPTCRKILTVPKQTAAVAAPIAQSAAATIPLPAFQETRPEPKRLSRLAIAAIVCCPIPFAGVICGHIALHRINHDPSLKGTTVATIGLVLGYFVLAAVIIWFVIKHVSSTSVQ